MEVRREITYAILRTLPAEAEPGTAEARTDEVLSRLPELGLLDAARVELARQKALQLEFTRQLKTGSQPRELAPPGSSVADALRWEATRLRQRAAVRVTPGFVAAMERGRRALIRDLEGRAHILDRTDPGYGDSAPCRPEPWLGSAYLADSDALRDLRLHLEEAGNRDIRARIRAATEGGAGRDLTALLLSELSQLEQTLTALAEAEEQTQKLRRRLAGHRNAEAPTRAELDWRAAVAKELREQANNVDIRPVISDHFGGGYQLVAISLADWLRRRADELSARRTRR